MQITFCYNVRRAAAGLDDAAQSEAEFDEPATIASIHDAIEAKISLDKALTKKVWRFHGLPTARFAVFADDDGEHAVDALRFPVLVKPNAEGSSKGLFSANLVDDPSALLPKVQEIRERTGGKVLVEEFLSGRELTVTVLGDPGVGDGLVALPIVEQDYAVFPDDLPHFAS